MHNWLLEVDGLTAQWKHGVEPPDGAACSDYMGELGRHGQEDKARAVNEDSTVNMDYDTSAMGQGVIDEDITEEQWIEDMNEAGWIAANEVPQPERGAATTTKHINELGFDKFRGMLIKHFNHQWAQRKVVWPSRTGTGTPYGWEDDMVVSY